MKKIIDVFDKFDHMLFFIPQMAVFIMMIVTTADAIARYVFGSGIIGAYHFTESYLMVIIVFISMSYVMKMGGHISIDFFLRFFPKYILRVLDIIYPLLAAALMFIIGYQSMLVTIEYFVNKNVAVGIIPWPTWLSWVWVPIGSFMFTIRLILISLKNLFEINRVED